VRAASANLVRVIDPRHELVAVYRSRLSPRRVGADGVLDGVDPDIEANQKGIGFWKSLYRGKDPALERGPLGWRLKRPAPNPSPGLSPRAPHMGYREACSTGASS